MLIIPVIDLRQGRVVRAQGGRRELYQISNSWLSATGDVIEIVAGLLRLHPFQVLYIADLEAIEGQGDNHPLVREVASRFPQLELWLDAGFFRPEDFNIWRDHENLRWVIGSESQRDIPSFLALAAALRGSSWVLSLDFRDQQLIGPQELLTETDAWPAQVIVMSLDCIGGTAGPDLERIKQVRELAGTRQFFAAGGVRDGEDVARLVEVGMEGVLVASVLHKSPVACREVLSGVPSE